MGFNKDKKSLATLIYYPEEKLINWSDILSFEGEYYVYVFSNKCLYNAFI